MKLVFITYNEAIDDEVMDVLKVASVEDYTHWTKVLGKGRTSGPHFATHIWPKANNVLMTAVEDEQAQKVLEGVRTLRQTLGHEGVKAFVVPLEAMT